MADLKIRVGAAIDASLNSVFRTVGDSARRASKQVSTEAERAAKEQIRAYQRADKEIEKAYQATQRAFEKAEAEKVRAVEKSARERVQRERQAMRELEREMARADRERERSAARAARASAAQGRADNRFHSTIAAGARAALGYGMRVAGDVARGLGVQNDPGAALGASIKREATAVQISNSAWIPGQTNRVDPREITNSANKVAMDTAMSSEDALQGLQSFVGLTGDLQTGRDILGEMGKLAKATGSSMGDMVEAAAQVSNSMGDIPDKGKAVAQAMRVFAGQGQIGAVEIRDLAGQMGKLAAQANNFKLDPTTAALLAKKGVTNETGQNLAVMGAMAQAARAHGGRATATTAVQSSMAFVRDLSSQAEMKRMAAAGIDVFSDASHTKARDPKDIILDIFKKTKGDMGQLAHLLPNQNSRAVVSAFGFDFGQGTSSVKRAAGESDAAFQARRTAAGLQAVSSAFDKYLTVAMESPEITAKFNAAMDTTESKVQLFNNYVAQTADELREGLFPVLQDLAPMFKDLARGVAGTLSAILGSKEEKRQREVASADIGATNAVAKARGRLRATGDPSNWVLQASGEGPMGADEARSLSDQLGSSREEALQKIQDLQKEREVARAGLPKSMGGVHDEGYGSGAPDVLEANKTKLESINSTIERLQQSADEAKSLQGELMKAAMTDALNAATLNVNVKNMPKPMYTSPTEFGRGMKVEAPVGVQ